MGTYAADPQVISELRRENAELKEIIRRQRRQIERLEKETARLKKEIERLGRQGKRQAAPFSKGPPKVDPQRPGRKPGAAYGRQGRREVPRRVDRTIHVDCPVYCPDCEGQVELGEPKSLRTAFATKEPAIGVSRHVLTSRMLERVRKCSAAASILLPILSGAEEYAMKQFGGIAR